MSVEFPEASILAQQLDESIKGMIIDAYELMDVERMKGMGFFNESLFDFESLVGKNVERVVSRGNTIRIKLSEFMNLLIAPEYGGVITYLPKGGKSPKYHLKLEFTDGSILTTRIRSMGLIYALRDKDLGDSYMYKRGFLGGVSPDGPEFTWDWFNNTMARRTDSLNLYW
jgi:hypothetical protein